MTLTSVADALSQLLHDVRETGRETVPIASALNRVLADDLSAKRSQPPFNASAMDGYAVFAKDAVEGALLSVVGESRAGYRYEGSMSDGQAVRIFTGAPVPDGADGILIQENAEPAGESIRVLQGVEPGRYLRPEGLDFKAGDTLLKSGIVLNPRTIALAASMNLPELPVRKRPRVAILATGDELVPPGGNPGVDQIISSNGAGISLLVSASGGQPEDRGIAADRIEAIDRALPETGEADILVIIGGASVGDHDLVQETLTRRGMALDFWRIAMRPGKPLMVGDLDGMKVLGLPGNPVSAMVCAHIFLKPLIRKMLALDEQNVDANARLTADLPANDERQDYIRSTLSHDEKGLLVTPFSRQDSSMLATFANSDALIIRRPHGPPAKAGEVVPIMILDQSS